MRYLSIACLALLTVAVVYTVAYYSHLVVGSLP